VLLVASDNDGIVEQNGSFDVGSWLKKLSLPYGTPNSAVQSESVIIRLSSALEATDSSGN
jgi:hypothetical protein